MSDIEQPNGVQASGDAGAGQDASSGRPRRRWWRTIAVPVAIGAVALTAVGITTFGGSRSSSIETEDVASVFQCRDMVTLSVAGRGDTPTDPTTLLLGSDGKPLPAALSGFHQSNWLDPIVNAPVGKVAEGQYAAMYIQYPANMNSYEDAVNTGVENAKKVMRAVSAACPNTMFAITGYSEGADVVRRFAMDIGNAQADANGHYDLIDPGKVLGVVILSDTGRVAGQTNFPGAAGNRPDGFAQQYIPRATPDGQGIAPDQSGSFGALAGKVASFCSDGDAFCAGPQNISLLQLAVNVGRQLDVDRLEKEGVNVQTGIDLATTISRVAINAFQYINAEPNWWTSNETFLNVLLKVSVPGYVPPAFQATAKTVGDDDATGLEVDGNGRVKAESLSPLANLGRKFVNEVVGLITTNINTIPVVMSDPYKLTLGENGHHFDYWHAADGQTLSDAKYAGQWLTALADNASNALKQLQDKQAADAAERAKAAAATATSTAKPTPTTTVAPVAPTTSAPAPAPQTSTAVPSQAPCVAVAADGAVPAAVAQGEAVACAPASAAPSAPTSSGGGSPVSTTPAAATSGTAAPTTEVAKPRRSDRSAAPGAVRT